MEYDSLFYNFDIEKLNQIKNLKNIQSLYEKIEEIYFTNYKTERNELLKTSILELIKIIFSF